MAMCGELCDDAKPKITRQLAGLMIKNCLEAKDARLETERAKQWMGLPLKVRGSIKAGVVRGLNVALQEVRRACAQIIAQIARIELPQKQWPELIAGLMRNVTTRSNASVLVQASVEAIGYVCETVDPTYLIEKDINFVLTAIVDAMSRKDPQIALRGCIAMYDTLDFFQANFNRRKESDIIMKQICVNAQSSDAAVRQRAYQCVWKVAELYYDKLKPYMQELFRLTMKSVKEDPQPVALQALEFWFTVCDAEADLLEFEPGKCANFIKMALNHLMPVVFSSLVKQEEDQDEDTWNMAKAGGTLLNLICHVVGNDIIKYVMQFVQAKHNSQNWRDREAAILAFGSIVTERTAETLRNSAMGFMPIVLNRLRTDPNRHVKDTAAWTLGQCCGYFAAKMSRAALDQVVSTLIGCLGMPPAIANNVCFACHNIAQSVENEGMADAPTNPLSPYFKTLIQKLLLCADRRDADECNVRTAAYEAINLIMMNGAQDSVALVKDLVPHICKKLSDSLNQGTTKESDVLQGLLCGVLQTAITKLGADVLPHSDLIMQQLLRVFSVKNATAHEESFMAIGALANAIDSNFVKYVEAVHPFLKMGLRQHENAQICIVATTLVGDITRALEGKLPPAFSDEIVRLLLENLRSPSLARKCKPPILGVFGDIALACGGYFEKYMDVVMAMLRQAGDTPMPKDEEDEEAIAFVEQLRENVLDAYAGIVQGVASKPGALAKHRASIANFLKTATEDPSRDDSRTRGIAGVLGDLVVAVGPQHLQDVLGHPFVKAIADDCRKSNEESTRSTGAWLESSARGGR